MKEFKFTQYNKEKTLFVGQKVECVYYHEHESEPNEYNRSIIQKLIDRPFKPVKLGVIVKDAGNRPYWLNVSGQEQYLYVKFKEYVFKKAIPISCITDAKESAIKTKAFLKLSEHKIGEPGYSKEVFEKLLNQAQLAENF